MSLYEPGVCEFTGWLFDLYPVSSGMVLWFQEEDGEPLRVTDERFRPSFYCRGTDRTPDDLRAVLEPFGDRVRVRWTRRREFFRDELVPVMEVRVENPLLFSKAVSRVTRRCRSMSFFNCDISLEQLYLYESDLFPMGRARVKLTEGGCVSSVSVTDDRWRQDYALPDLRTMHVRLQGKRINPRHGKRGGLEVECGGRTRLLEGRSDRDIMKTFSSLLDRHDPDLVYTEWGDSYLVDRIQERARQAGVNLPLDRDETVRMRRTDACNYESYGRILYHGGSRIFRGRWHIDRRNSFILSESGLPGLVQLARVSDMPVQVLARRSPGTAISSMQLAEAGSHHYMIPWRKKEVEQFKSAAVLLDSDKGGLTYVPPHGFYESVAELDFASMYPTIMSRYNISPETVLCEECDGMTVPETGYRVCENRRGLIPEVLESILEMRSAYKEERDRADHSSRRKLFDRRQTALKWILVTCFGYLGYKNARFGRIEAHEAVTAISREILLRSKEMAESKGYRMLHALVDSIWLRREGATRADYEQLAGEISREVDLPLELEGIFRWIVFVRSKSNPTIGVSNRYFGVFEDGTVKSRGIALRRRDTPAIVCETQERMLSVLSGATSAEEYRERIPEALDVLEASVQRVRDHDVTPEELAIQTRISKDPEDYKHNTVSACAVKWLLDSDVDLMPGEMISYVIRDRSAEIPKKRAVPLSFVAEEFEYDQDEYVRYLREAAWTLVQPFVEEKEKLAS